MVGQIGSGHENNDADGESSAAPCRVSTRAPAKVNLYLRVGSRTADGFHRLVSWICTVGLFDTLDFDFGPHDAGTRTGGHPLRLTCDDPSLPVDSRNLTVRAAEELARNAHEPPPMPGIRLAKRIPVGAGLGGGSSDAATTLRVLNRLWKLKLPDERLSEIAAKLGSDVPFFLHGPSSVCTGRGELVNPTPSPAPKWCLLILPALKVPTATVYSRFDDLRLGSERVIESQPAWRDWSSLSADQLLSRLVNDLEPAAFALHPELGRLRETAEHLLGRRVRMSGSGSSLFTLYDEQVEANRAADRVAAQCPSMRVLAVRLAPGAEDDSTTY